MAEHAGNKGLFLDLVGTLVRMDENRQLPLDGNGRVVVELLPGVAEKLAPMRDCMIFVVTNQASVARGRLTIEQVEGALAQLDRKLGGILTAWEVCPHDEGDRCECRKPRAGLIAELARVHGVDLGISTMVGDQEIDALAARAAGVGTFIYARDFFGRHGR